MLTISLIIFGVMRPPKTCTKTKISQFNVTIPIDKYVIWLDISVNEAHFMNTFHSACQFGYVKPETHGNK